MYHHSESPEVIHAHLAEWERTVAAHARLEEASRLHATPDDRDERTALRSLLARMRQIVRPVSRLRQEPSR